MMNLAVTLHLITIEVSFNKIIMHTLIFEVLLAHYTICMLLQRAARRGSAAACRRRPARPTRPTRRPAPTPARRTAATAKQVRPRRLIALQLTT